MNGTLEYIKTSLELIKHLQILIAVVIGGGLSWFLTMRSYKTGNFRSRIEFIGVEPTPEGIDFHTHGPQMDLSQVVGLKRLEKIMITATRHMSDGDQVLRLKKGSDQRRMMEIFEDWLTGNDPRANMAALKGRPVNEDRIGFCPTYYHEEGDDAMIRVYIFDSEWLRTKHASGSMSTLLARKKRFQYRTGILEQIVREEVSENSRSGETAAVWHTVVKTAKTEKSSV